MAGTIRQMLDTIIETRAKQNPMLKGTTKTKLILQGLNPDKFNSSTPDDPALIARVRQVAAEFGIQI